MKKIFLLFLLFGIEHLTAQINTQKSVSDAIALQWVNSTQSSSIAPNPILTPEINAINQPLFTENFPILSKQYATNRDKVGFKFSTVSATQDDPITDVPPVEVVSTLWEYVKWDNSKNDGSYMKVAASNNPNLPVGSSWVNFNDPSSPTPIYEITTPTGKYLATSTEISSITARKAADAAKAKQSSLLPVLSTNYTYTLDPGFNIDAQSYTAVYHTAMLNSGLGAGILEMPEEITADNTLYADNIKIKSNWNLNMSAGDNFGTIKDASLAIVGNIGRFIDRVELKINNDPNNHSPYELSMEQDKRYAKMNFSDNGQISQYTLDYNIDRTAGNGPKENEKVAIHTVINADGNTTSEFYIPAFKITPDQINPIKVGATFKAQIDANGNETGNVGVKMSYWEGNTSTYATLVGNVNQNQDMFIGLYPGTTYNGFKISGSAGGTIPNTGTATFSTDAKLEYEIKVEDPNKNPILTFKFSSNLKYDSHQGVSGAGNFYLVY